MDISFSDLSSMKGGREEEREIKQNLTVKKRELVSKIYHLFDFEQIIALAKISYLAYRITQPCYYASMRIIKETSLSPDTEPATSHT